MTQEQAVLESYRNCILAALASSTGAGIAGVGAEASMPQMPIAIALIFLVAGIAVHVGGMTLAHRADRNTAIYPPRWHQALSLLCWTALVIGTALAATIFAS